MANKGFVSIISSGPGDLALMTLAGLTAIQLADVVVYDRKVVGELQAFIPPGTEVHELAEIKEANEDASKSVISNLIVGLAEQGKHVARLKVGDTCVFGREDHELDMLRERGIPYRIIPGITSAIAAPVYAGVPITHRDYTSSVHFFTAMGKDGSRADIPFKELVAIDGTLVFLMAAWFLDDLCSGLIAAGMSPEMPAVLVENGTMPRQRRILSRLSELPGKAREAEAGSPSILIVGKVCGLADRYDWTGNLPLWGKKILVMSHRDLPNLLAAKLRDIGAGVDEYVCAGFQPVARTKSFCEDLRLYTWLVFTNFRATEAFFLELARNRFDIRRLAEINFGAIGERTEKVLVDKGIFAEYTRDVFEGEALAKDIRKCVQIGDKVLIYGAGPEDMELAEMLRRIGVHADAIRSYQSVTEDTKGGGFRERVAAGEYDAVTFTSMAAVRVFGELMEGTDYHGLKAVCGDKHSAAAAVALGMEALETERPDDDAMVELFLGLPSGRD